MFSLKRRVLMKERNLVADLLMIDFEDRTVRVRYLGAYIAWLSFDEVELIS